MAVVQYTLDYDGGMMTLEIGQDPKFLYEVDKIPRENFHKWRRYSNREHRNWPDGEPEYDEQTAWVHFIESNISNIIQYLKL